MRSLHGTCRRRGGYPSGRPPGRDEEQRDQGQARQGESRREPPGAIAERDAVDSRIQENTPEPVIGGEDRSRRSVHRCLPTRIVDIAEDEQGAGAHLRLDHGLIREIARDPDRLPALAGYVTEPG
jgi:hypothetical protein